MAEGPMGAAESDISNREAASRAASHLASNIRALREQRKLTQQQLAVLSGLPRPTIANLETGMANPTLGVLVKLATALGVGFEDLVLAPRSSCEFYPAGTLPSRSRSKTKIQRLVPESVLGMEMERLEFAAGAKWNSSSKTVGTREYVTCEKGQLELSVGEERFVLQPGDVLALQADQEHIYRNAGKGMAVAYRVVALTASTLR